jgi:hypothetical protein
MNSRCADDTKAALTRPVLSPLCRSWLIVRFAITEGGHNLTELLRHCFKISEGLLSDDTWSGDLCDLKTTLAVKLAMKIFLHEEPNDRAIILSEGGSRCLT